MAIGRASRLIRAWIRLSRPHFLLGGALMYALGAASARPIDWSSYAIGQAMVVLVQLTAHYANEYSDLDADRAVTNRTLFSGGSGVLVTGLLPPRAPLVGGVVATTLAGVVIAVVAVHRPAAAFVGLVALGVSWAYSMPPPRLVGTGVGELAATVVVVVAVPTVGALTQRGDLTAELLWAMAVLGAVHVAMMLAFELPDIDADAASGKRVLAVRLGPAPTRRLITGLSGGAALTLAGGVVIEGLPGSAVAAGLAAGPGVWMIRSLRSCRHQASTAAAVATFAVAGIGLLYALL